MPFLSLARLKTDGTLDSSFDSDGKATYGFPLGGANAYACALHGELPNSGKLVMGGSSWNGVDNDSTLTRICP